MRTNTPSTFTLGKFLLVMGVCNILILFIVSQNRLPASKDHRELMELYQPPESSYSFDDPVAAYYVLEQLDIFEQINVTKKDLQDDYRYKIMGLTADDDYCKKHRAHIVNHPEVIFEEKNIVTSLIPNSLLRRRVIPSIGSDVMPYVGSNSAFRGKFIYDIRTDVNNFFTFFGIYNERAIGHQYSCLSQSSNAIPGHQYLFRKDYISEGIVKYAEKYESRPSCFNYDKFFPETWVLYKEDQCRKFFDHFNSEVYQQLKKERGGIVYMRKIGARIHSGQGVFPMNQTQEDYLTNTYKGGELCGKVDHNNIIQYFVHNPLLLYGHKFDFRIYMLVASTNPLIAYYYDGFLRVSLHKYKADSKELGALLTNTALSKTIFNQAAENGTFNGMTEAELKDFHLWNFQRLEDYLYDNGVVSDRNWLNNYLRPEFKKALTHLVRMSQEPFMTKSSIYHLFGMDFMLDDNLNLWFIEANASPALEGFSKEMMDFVSKMLTDHFEIVYGLMKSRMKRVIQYVNTLGDENQISRVSEDSVFIKDLETKRQEFKEISKNKFEPEFEPNPENKFQPIIDENIEGAGRYFNLIREECL